MAQLTIEIDDDLKEFVDEYCNDNKTTIQALIENLLMKFIIKHRR